LLGGTTYKFDFVVPSFPNFGAWRIDWTYTYGSGTNGNTITRYFVVQPNPTVDEYKQSSIILEQEADVQEFNLNFQAIDISATMKKVGTLEGAKFPNAPTVLTATIGSGITEVSRPDGGFTYVLNIPATPQGEYIVIWKYRPIAGQPYERVMDLVFLAPALMFSLIKQLRIYVDKIQKRVGIIQAYADGDLCNNFAKAMNFMNQVAPLSSWTFMTFPYQWFEQFLIKSAAWWTLRTQYILEGDLQFDYAGQTITLTYDHLSFISDEIGRLENELGMGGATSRGSLPNTKLQYSYNTGLNSVVAVRTRRATIPQWGS
jgi:hypothetical protein